MATKVKIDTTPLPLPPFYNEKNAMKAEYQADATQLMVEAEKWRTRHALKPAGGDQFKIWLLDIDGQFDFSFPTGKLYVAGRSGKGAMEAQNRLATFGYRYLRILSYLKHTMDTHLPYQVFFTSAHLLKDGSHPNPNTVITADEYRRGMYRPNPVMAKQINADYMWLQRQFTYYCEQLEKGGKHQLYLWDYHCLLGSPGHRLAGVLEELRLFHSFVRGADNMFEIKGGNPLTEHYSVFSPEVTMTWEGKPLANAQKNTALIKTLLTADMVIIAGLASSHCVKESVHDFLTSIKTQDQALAKKVYFLEDCTAAVVIPNVVDFTADAEKALDEYRDAGVHIVKSTDPIESWPDVPFA